MNKSFSDAILPYIRRYEGRVSACGVKYGSVMYITFGEGIDTPSVRNLLITVYSATLTFGADDWFLINCGDTILDSEFSDIGQARDLLNNVLIGRKLLDIKIDKNDSVIIFDNDLILKSAITSEEPASGFLHSFYLRDGPIWVTIDGVTIKNDDDVVDDAQ
jgi:hypothetical protein